MDHTPLGNANLFYGEWTEHDRHQAKEQGWVIVQQQIKAYYHIGESKMFNTDKEALEFVQRKATNGDKLCKKVLNLLIEKRLNEN